MNNYNTFSKEVYINLLVDHNVQELGTVFELQCNSGVLRRPETRE